MNNLTTLEQIIIIGIVAVAFMLGAILGSDSTTKKIEREATEAGAGEYYLNENYGRAFRWISAK